MRRFKSRFLSILPVIIIVFTTVAVFSISINFPIMHGFDDNEYITNNVDKLSFNLANLKHCFTYPFYDGNYIPNVMLSYMLDYTLWGLNSTGYHLQNIFWHILTVLGIYACMRELGVKKNITFFLVLIFAIHPQRVESVVWLSERKDVMCGAFYFWSIYSYLKSERGKILPFIISIILFLFALLSKGMAVTLPVILVLYEFHKRKSFNPLFYLRRFWVYIILTIFVVIITKKFHSVAGGQTDLSRQIFIVFHNYLWYIRSFSVPLFMNPVYPRLTINNNLIILICCGYFSVIILCLVAIKENPKNFLYNILPLVCCYIVALIPVAGIYHIGYIDYADRYSYITSPFLLLGIGLGVDFMMNKKYKDFFDQKIIIKYIAAGFAVVSILLLAVQSVRYSFKWENMHSLFTYATQIETPNHVALGALGDIEIDNGNYEKVMEIADRLENLNENWMKEKILADNRNKANFLRGMVFAHLGKNETALIFFEKIQPFEYTLPHHMHLDYEMMLASMAMCYKNTGKDNKAEYCLEELIKWMKHDPRKQYYQGLLALFRKNYKKAAELFTETLEKFPDNKRAEVFLEKAKSKLSE